MFTEQTTLILGAGASCPYGYPSGQQLVTAILNLPYATLSGYTRNPDAHEEWWSRFARDLRASHTPSIDAFLQNRREYAEVGKLAIAHVMLATEHAHDPLVEAADWYTLLVNALGSTLDQIANNKLSIFTFNYDRSLEYFLHGAIAGRFGDAARSRNPVIDMSIAHIYGSLEKLPWQKGNGNGREYGVMNPNAVTSAARGLRLIYEAEEDRILQASVTDTLKQSAHVFFRLYRDLSG